PAGRGEELPEHRVTVSPFWLDKFEVTVSRFRRYLDSLSTNVFIADGAGAHPKVSGTGWQQAWNDLLLDKDAFAAAVQCTDSSTYTPGVSNSEQLPMNCIMWYEAFAFCYWDGGRLPTEAEWEFAAAGGAQNRLYPWGQAAPTNVLVVTNCW